MRQCCLDIVDRLDDVGPRLAIKDDENGGLAIGKTGIAQILDESVTSATSARFTGGAVAIGDDQVAVLRCDVAWSLV